MNLLRELITFDFECECIRVSFTYEGVDYSFDVPKDGTWLGKNTYYFSNEILNIYIQWNTTYWALIVNFESGVNFTYIDTTDNTCPIFDTWTFNEGVEVENLTTTPCE